ncbi:hypothetical protein NKH77_47285 [Streptomyces sp. M19]
MIGGALVTAGIVWLTQIDGDSSYAGAVVGPMLLFGTGSGLSFLPLNMVILSQVQPQDAGAASGLLQAMQQVGATLGLAILVNLFETARKDATLPRARARRRRGTTYSARASPPPRWAARRSRWQRC